MGANYQPALETYHSLQGVAEIAHCPPRCVCRLDALLLQYNFTTADIFSCKKEAEEP